LNEPLKVVNDFSTTIAGQTVIISNQPYFYKKAELFPGSAFVIGVDTAVRLINVWNCLLLCSILHEFIISFPAICQYLIVSRM
jgi:hypothetical protein